MMWYASGRPLTILVNAFVMSELQKRRQRGAASAARFWDASIRNRTERCRCFVECGGLPPPFAVDLKPVDFAGAES
jgi:hypothetical protein